jgi:hypothetical protein
VLLPSATVLLLLMCNDKAVLGPWVNRRGTNLFTGTVIWVLVMLSIVLTASVLYPDMSGETIVEILAGGGVLGLVVALVGGVLARGGAGEVAQSPDGKLWRMPPLATLAPYRMTALSRVWMIVLRAYLIVAAGLVLVRIVELALGGNG